MGVGNAAMVGAASGFNRSMCLPHLFLALSAISSLRVIRRMCLWLLCMRGLLWALLLGRFCILCLLLHGGLSLMLLLPWLLCRLVLLLCRFSLLLLSVLFLPLFLSCVGRGSGSEKHNQYCGSDWEFHVCHLNLDASRV
jgi:hypothetical protein